MLYHLMSVVQQMIIVILILLVIVYVFFKWKYQYWQRRNLQYLQPKIPYGNLASPTGRKENLGVIIKYLYEQMKARGWKHGGAFFATAPTYFAIDLEILKNILTKDFHHFVDRGIYHNEKDYPLSANLFTMDGTKWRQLRTKLTPTFTSGKMKMMFHLLIECEKSLHDRMKKEVAKHQSINIKEILRGFTTDTIGSCAFGLDFNASKDENNAFKDHASKIFATGQYESFKRIFMRSFPDLARRLHVTVVPKDVSDFFIKLITDTVKNREETKQTRKDFLQLLIDLKNDVGDDGKTLTIEEIAAQSFVFYFGGFETSSTTMTFALYELAKHQAIQQKVRKEIKTVLAAYDGKVTYDALQDMKYMTQVIDETLRKYPPASFVTRKCILDYKVPDEDLTIEKGTTVVIPIYGIHYDEEYYLDPEIFDPDRFTEENKRLRHNYAYLPFGEGPRICIGMRFGMMQTKVGLISMLKNYAFTVNETTKEPLSMQTNSFILAAEGDIWLDAHNPHD